VDDFFDLLQTGCNINSDHIFCTSVEGAGIETGQDFIDWIEKNLKEACVIILFLTPNYYDSKFCIAEMGAAWALRSNIFPLMAPDLERDPGVVFLGRQTQRMDKVGLDTLRDFINENCDIRSPQKTSRWNNKRKSFLKQFDVKYGDLPKPDSVSIEKYTELEEELEDSQDLYNECLEGKRNLEEKIEKIKKTKDKEEIREIELECSDEVEKYNQLVTEIEGLLSGVAFDGVIVRCLFQTINRRAWCPSRDQFKYYEDEIRSALENQYIEQDFDVEEEREGFNLDLTHPKFKKAVAAIERLSKFIEEELSEEVLWDLEEEKEIRIHISNAEFWREEFDTHLAG
jgi:hypothetical protein